MTEPSSSPGTIPRGGWLGLALLLLVALPVHLWLLGARWINPDEGAHLMDGLLLLDGQVPGVDFGARQPFYVLATAAGLKIFGVGFAPGRVLAMACTLGTAALVFAIARDLFDELVALVSAALLLFMPFSLIMSVNAKTEPLAMLLAAGAIWMGVRGRLRPDAAFFYFSGAGVLAALGFYVRQSSLAIPLALLPILLSRLGWAPRQWVGRVASLAGGFLAVSLITGAIYARHMSVEVAWRNGNINPAAFVLGNVGQLTEAVRSRLSGPGPVRNLPPIAQEPALTTPDSLDEPQRVSGAQPFDVTLRNLVETARFNAVFFAGLLLYPLAAALGRKRRATAEPDEHDWEFASLVLFSWVVMLGAAYLFWAIRRGFFQAYFLELLPPLVIVTGAAAVSFARRFVGATKMVWMGLCLALLVLTLLVVPGVVGSLPLSRPLYFFIPTGALAVVHFFDSTESRRWVRAVFGVALLTIIGFLAGPPLPGVLAMGLYAVLATSELALIYWAARIPRARYTETAIPFGCYALTVAALFVTLAESTPRVRLAYDCIWSPETVRAVAEEVRGLTNPDDIVLSGGVIWELQADRRPFMNTSHPLGFQNALAGQVVPAIRRALAADPPAVVVFDGYTEQTYLAAVPELRDFVEARYTRTLMVEASTRFPIEVYRLND